MMKRKLPLLLLAFFLSTIFSFGQVGTTILYDDNFGDITLNYVGLVNGKHSYSGVDGTATVVVSWSGTRWEITINVGTGDILEFVSNTITAMNPPNFAIGMWTDERPGEITMLEGLSGNGTTNIALPVELISFTVSKLDQSLELKWQTASELNNEKFVIETSQDGKDFQKLGEVKGKDSTSSLSNYSFSIIQPRIGLSYYRLKQMDFDGQFEYSKIVSTLFEKDSKYTGTIYPNPSRLGLVNLGLSSNESKLIHISVFDVSGRLITDQIRSLEKGNNHLNLDFSSLDQGIYIIQLGDDESSNYKKLIIN